MKPVDLHLHSHRVNWLESTSRTLRGHAPETTGCAEYITERLSALLLERLPEDVANTMLELLPENVGAHSWPLRSSAGSHSNESIGYISFVEKTSMALGCTAAGEFDDALARRVTDVFLWAIAQEVPAELKSRMIDALPADLRVRINLYSAGADESKVA